jgi:hypothetical protein
MAPNTFKELFIICWAGTPKVSGEILSRVDIELINEQVKLFYSAQDVVVLLMMKILLPLLNMSH